MAFLNISLLRLPCLSATQRCILMLTPVGVVVRFFHLFSGTALWGILLVLVEALQGRERGFLFGLLQKCVCVYHLNRCKTSDYCRAAGERCSQRPMKTLQCSCENVPAYLYIYIYVCMYVCIVAPLGAYKSQRGGKYVFIYRCCFLIVNVYCGLYFIYLYRFISSC